jgi:hypothetical protein
MYPMPRPTDSSVSKGKWGRSRRMDMNEIHKAWAAAQKAQDKVRVLQLESARAMEAAGDAKVREAKAWKIAGDKWAIVRKLLKEKLNGKDLS